MPPAKTRAGTGSGRVSIINAVKTTLNFFVLVALLVESALGGLALKSGENLLTIVYLMVAVLLALVGAVVVIAFRRPDLMLPSEEGTSQSRRFSERVSGHWWQEQHQLGSVSFVEISPHAATATVRMTGQTYSPASGLTATWETVAACVNPDERKVFYSWKGPKSSQPYEGFGELSFRDSLDSGDGSFLDLSLSDGAAMRKTVRLTRASKDDIRAMGNSSIAAGEEYVRKRFQKTVDQG